MVREQEAEAQKARKAAHRAIGLQRQRAAQRVLSVLDYDEGELDAEMEGSARSSAGPSQAAAARSTQQQHAGAAATHEDQVLRLEQRMRQHTAEQLEWGERYAPARAAATRQDLERLVATVQQRVHDTTAELMQAPWHVGCTASAGSACCLAILSRRQVFLRTLIGTGVISIPTLK